MCPLQKQNCVCVLSAIKTDFVYVVGTYFASHWSAICVRYCLNSLLVLWSTLNVAIAPSVGSLPALWIKQINQTLGWLQIPL